MWDYLSAQAVAAGPKATLLLPDGTYFVGTGAPWGGRAKPEVTVWHEQRRRAALMQGWSKWQKMWNGVYPSPPEGGPPR